MRGTKAKRLRKSGERHTHKRRKPLTGVAAIAVHEREMSAREPYTNDRRAKEAREAAE